MSVAVVWLAYLQYHPHALLSTDRLRLIEARLGDGYPPKVLVDAIIGNHLDPHSNGENDRFKRYHGINLILRDADHVERYAELAQGERPTAPVEAAWRYYNLFASTDDFTAAEALDMVRDSYPEEAYLEVVRRVEGDELGDRRAG